MNTSWFTLFGLSGENSVLQMKPTTGPFYIIATVKLLKQNTLNISDYTNK